MVTRSTRYILPVAVAAAILISLAGVAVAQTGTQVKIVGVVLSVKHRAGPAGAFVTSKIGSLLPPGSRVQTGARSKCALKFPNGAVIRMDERSDLVIQSVSDTSTQLNSGQIWAKVISGTTARVQGSSGVAVVKGTEWTFKDESITCYDGAVSYEVGNEATDVPIGYEGYIDKDGNVRVRTAPGRNYPGADLNQWFGGMPSGVTSLVTPGATAGTIRKDADISIDRAITSAVTPRHGAVSVVIMDAGASLESAQMRAGAIGDPLASAQWGNFPGVDQNTLAPLYLSRPGTGWGGVRMGSASLAQSPQLPDRQYLFGPYTLADAFAYVGAGGSTYGLRVRPHIVWKDVYVEVGATTRTSSWYGDGTDITEAFAQLKQDWGAVTIGRQRFLEGPVNNSRLGSLLTFETGDAARLQTDIGKLSVDFAYVHKMSPIIKPTSQGFYGRVQCPVADGTVGANIVTQEGTSGAGYSVDAAIPVVEGKLDLYGEWGRDAFDRDLYTVGAYFPSLYQSQDIDLFVEYADRDGLPNLASARVYKHFNEDLTGVFTVDKLSGDSVNFGAGVIWRFGD